MADRLGPLQNVTENIGVFFFGLILGAVGWHFKDHIISWLGWAMNTALQITPFAPKNGNGEQ